ncbi:MAG TPA: amino acid adenylation domain-containing protein [Blastocatellia bacterium]|nr:amino acid adenylation domain-containing protein [Blastocatellia bacterium]
MDMTNVEDIYTLSHVQEAMLLEAADSPSFGRYVSHSVFTAHGLNVPAFAGAWQKVVERHQALRTSFAWARADKPVQVVHKRLDYSLDERDWRGLSVGEQQRRLDELIDGYRASGFDTAVAPLARFAVCRIADDTYQIVLSYHRLVLDSWSLSLILKEAAAFYGELSNGRGIKLEQPRPYKNFIGWLRQQDRTAAEDFWRRSLHGFTEPTVLPASAGRRELREQAAGFYSETLALPDATAERVASFERQHQVSAKTVVLAAWALLLSRYTDSPDVLFGVELSGRPAELEGSESIIGSCMNLLPVRVEVEPSAEVLPWLRGLQAQIERVRRHTDDPVARIRQIMGLSDGSPLFEHAILLDSPPMDLLSNGDGGGLHIRDVKTVARPEVSLTLTPRFGRGISLEITCDSRRFDSATVSGMLGHLSNLIEGMTRSEAEPLRSLDMLGEDEKHRLLIDWNDTATDYPAHRSICELVEEHARRTPEAVAVALGDERLTFSELDRRANRLGNYLRRAGVGPDSLVGICAERSLEMIVGLLGILKAGGAYVPLDPRNPLERMSAILEETQAPLVLTQERLLDRLPASAGQIFCLDSEWGAVASESEEPPASGVTPDNLAYVMYTSGSTGRPKGVAVTHRNVVRLIKRTNFADFDSGQVFLQYAPISFDASTFEIWGSLANGARLVVMPAGSPTLSELGRVIRENRVTTLWLTAALFHAMVDERLQDLRGLKQLLAGGDVLSISHVEKAAAELPSCALINGYGPTESTTFACCYKVPDEPGFAGSVPIGTPISNTQVYILDTELRPVPCGMPGELYIGGDGLARCYHNRPDITAERFVPDPFGREPGGRLYRTGDRVAYRRDGNIEFLGRGDRQVKVRGFRIELDEIESILSGHPSVREVAVTASGDEAGDKRLAAYVVAASTGEALAGELREYLRAKLPEFMVPSTYVLLEEMPMTPSGKVDRKRLPEPSSVRPQAGPEFAAPASTLERTLAEIWADVLGVEEIGVDDNFFDLGGDSLRSVQVIAQAEERGLNIELEQLFLRQTIRELVEHIGVGEAVAGRVEARPFSLISEQDRVKVPGDVEDAYPLARLQAGMVYETELRPESAVYHDIFSFELQVPFDLATLRESIERLLSRHEVLRTSFDLTSYSEPLQLVHRSVPVPLEVVDLRPHAPEEQKRLVESWTDAEKSRAFNWSAAPLMRMAVHRFSDDSFLFTLSFHHSILDGWSLAALLTELFNGYLSALRGEESKGGGRPSTLYRDFIELERRAIESPESREFWERKLAGSTLSVLPRWTSAPQEIDPLKDYSVVVPISAEMSGGVKQLAQMAGVPVKTVLLAAHLRVMSLIGGQGDVVTGLVSHGRPEMTDADKVLGLFLNATPFRVQLAGGTWLDLMRQVFEAERESLPYRWYPMSELQARNGGRPLFETSFTYTNFHVYHGLQEMPGINVTGATSYAKANVPFGALFSLDSFTSQVDLVLSYDPNRLADEQVEAIGQYYRAALTAMAQNPLARYELETLLPASEYDLLVSQWNQTAREFPERLCAHGLFEEQAKRTPDAVAVTFEDSWLTYRELNRRANKVAHHLRSLGVGPDIPVGLFVNPSIEMLVGLLGILKAGGAYLPLDPDYPIDRLAFLLQDAAAPVLVTQEHLLDRLPVVWAQVVCLDSDWDLIGQQSDQKPDAAVEPEHLAYVIYTSGSTGKPKGVMATHGAIANDALAMIALSGIGGSQRLFQMVSLSFDASAQQIFMTLGSGASLALHGRPDELPVADLIKECERSGVTTLYLPPAYWHLMVDEYAGRRASAPEWIDMVLVGGESPSLARLSAWARVVRHRSGFVNAYGPAEATVTATAFRTDLDPSELGWYSSVPIGQPIANVQVYLLDEHMSPVPIATPGELYIGGDGLARGYLNHVGLTSERFTPNPFSREPGQRLYRTGDLARYMPDGKLEFLGRVDQQVKIRGVRIEPGEIEAALVRHADVSQAVVTTREGSREDKQLVAYVVLRNGAKVGHGTLRDFLRDQLPDYMMPSAFVELPSLPLTPNGKIDYGALPKPDQSRGEGQVEYVAPRTETERVLAGIWGQLLGVEQVGSQDNFFDLGGHSLDATQMVSRLREVFQVELQLRTLFENPTVAGLGERLDALSRSESGLQAPPISPAARDGLLPLSFAQQRLWFIYQMKPDSTAYNVPAAVRLKGNLDVGVFARTLGEVVKRHESLRTTFALIDGQPVQVIHPPEPVEIPVEDLSHLPEAEREAEALRLAKEEAERPFNLTDGPLLRVSLLRLAGDEHVVLFTLHHIISDGWSAAILVSEVAALYSAFLQGEPSPLPDLEIQYADFAAWQREWLQGEALEKQLSYWEKHLAGAPAVLELPADRPRPAVHTFRGSAHEFRVPAEVSQSLKEIGNLEGATLFMTLLAAFDVLLSRYTGQEDIVVGTDIANRNHAETEGLIGFFINQIVMRADLSGDPSFTELLRRVRAVALDAYAHQDLPFERLVAALQPERSLSHTPVFQVKFVLQNAPPGSIELPGLSLSPLSVPSSSVGYDLILSVEETPDGLRSEFHYSTDLFDESTVRRMSGHFQTLLAAIASDPEQRKSDLQILTDGERHQLLVGFNDTSADYPVDKCVHEMFEAQAERLPGAVAVVFGQERITYDDLNRRANRLAHHLRGMGVGPEVRVAICLERSINMVVSILGVLKAGGAYVPLDPAYPLKLLSIMLDDAGAPVLLTEESVLEKLPVLWSQVVCVDSDWGMIAGCDDHNLSSGVRPDNAAYLIYTSGSTGNPKGVVIEHRGVASLVTWQAHNYGVTTETRVSQYASYSFDAAVGETFMALLNGATLIMLDRFDLDPERLIAAVNEHDISVMVMVPSAIKALDPDLLKRPERFTLVAVGEACPQELALKWAKKCNFMNAYGPTEYTVYSHLWRADERYVRERGVVPVGTPIFNCKSYILDASLNPVPVGVTGEIYLSGPGIARGYLNKPDTTAERFIPNRFYETAVSVDHGTLVSDSARSEISDLRGGGDHAHRPPAPREPVTWKKNLPAEVILELVEPLDDELVEKTRLFISDHITQNAVYEGFCRYLIEGANGSYASRGINVDVLKLLLPFESYEGLRGIDFGFGNGEIMQGLASIGASMRGLDLNPFFVQKAKENGLDARMARIDLPVEKFLKETGLEEGSQDFVISTLLLDRLERPKDFLRNMFHVLKPRGRFAIQTLLPIVGVDDGNVDDPITYTPEECRITPGRSVEEDKAALISLTYELGARGLRVYTLPYVVTSRDGLQEYEIWSFVGYKGNGPAVTPERDHYERMYRTGDLGRYLPDGSIEFRGRVDTQVKVRGYRIELGEVEAALLQQAGVKDAVVLAREDVPGDKRIVAYVVAGDESPSFAADLRTQLRERLPDYMVPSAFVVLDALPLTPNNKLDRRALPAPSGASRESEYVAPSTRVEQIIADVWREVLNVEKVGLHDNFFDLGGHSLLIVEANSKLRKLLGRDFPITEMFQYPTVSSLAKYLSAQEDEQPSYRQTRDRAGRQKEAVRGQKQPARKKTSGRKKEEHTE